MRYSILLSLFILSFVNPSPAEQALLSGKITHGGYGAPVIKFTSINGESAVLVGGQGGWIINHTLAIGGGGFGLATEHHPEMVYATTPWSKDELRTSVGYVGVMLSYIGMSDQLLHPTLDVLIGGGELHEDFANDSFEHDQWEEEDHDCPSSEFFIVEPTISAELNIVSFMRLNAGVGYRFVDGVDSWGFSDSDISGLSVSTMLKFGKF